LHKLSLQFRFYGKAHKKPNSLPDDLRVKIQSLSPQRKRDLERGFPDTVKSKRILVHLCPGVSIPFFRQRSNHPD
jgi:hypothetical protein